MPLLFAGSLASQNKVRKLMTNSYMIIKQINKFQVLKRLVMQGLVKELEGLSLMMSDVWDLNLCWHFVHIQGHITALTQMMLE